MTLHLINCLALPIRTDAEVGGRHRPPPYMLLDLLTTLVLTLATPRVPDPSGKPAAGLRGWFDGLPTLTRIVIVQALIENTVRQRMIAAMKQLDPDYTDWMVTVTYRIPAP